MSTRRPAGPQTLIGVGVLLVGVVMVGGALAIPSEAGYSGVGPNFLPWVVGSVLLLCGALVVWESRAGGFRNMDDPSGSAQGYWPGFAWMSVALLANAALITTIGFILSCTLCFVLAVRGLRNADQQANPPGFDLRQLLLDAVIGFVIAAPVYWMFTKLLAINLPGLTATGWI
jgi:putative tricarboxylic transport membrane protein